MSRIGNKIINLPEGVVLTVNGNVVNVKGPKGTLDVTLNNGITLSQEGNVVTLKRINDEKQIKQNHGTSRANLANAIEGVSKGFEKTLVMVGIGFRANMAGKAIVLYAGYSHTVKIEPVPNSEISTAVVNNVTEIYVKGIDKQAVGQTAALIRDVRRPEPYLGKGIRYKDEHITLKEGKKAATAK